MLGATFRRLRFYGIALVLGMFFSFAATPFAWGQKSGVTIIRPQVPFRTGDFYTTQESGGSPGIIHYGPKGKLLGVIPVSHSEGYYMRGLRGLGFGPDGRLYVVGTIIDAKRNGFFVFSIDDKGETRRAFSYFGEGAWMNGYTGKIAFDKNNHLLVATMFGVVQFPLDGAEDSGKLLFKSNDWVYGFISLPSGKLMYFSDNKLHERAADGTNPRTVSPYSSSIGLAYEVSTNTLFASRPGNTIDPDGIWPVIALDGTTLARKSGTNLEHGVDICVASDHRVVVTSTTQPITIFDKDLRKIGTFENPPEISSGGNSHCFFITQKAERYFKKALEYAENMSPPQPGLIVTCLNGLGYFYKETGRLQDSAPLLKKALKKARPKSGGGNMTTATCLNSLAELYQDQKKPQKAFRLFNKALKIRRAYLPANHPLVAQSLYNRGTAYASLNQRDEARAMYKKALAIVEEQISRELGLSGSALRMHPEVHRIVKALESLGA